MSRALKVMERAERFHDRTEGDDSSYDPEEPKPTEYYECGWDQEDEEE